MDESTENISKILLQEIIHKRNFIVIVFSIISILIVVTGSKWPKVYQASTTIFVEEQNILGPLMEGAAIQTEVVDRAAIAREMIYGHKIIYQLLQKEGLLESNPDPVVQEKLMNGIKERTTITNARPNLIRIEYKDSSASKAYRITNTLAELFIEGSLSSKEKESTDAFEFIDKQAMEYQRKLQISEDNLKKFKSENVDSQPVISGQLGQRSAELRRTKEQIVQDLREQKIRKSSLVKQLSGEAHTSSIFSRSEQYRTRIAELQTQLDDLRLKFHETYPDIVQLKTQIQELRVAVTEAENTEHSGTNDMEKLIVDERVLQNPVYQQLQQELYNVNTEIETLTARLDHTNFMIQKQFQRARKVESYQATMTELTRDYEINQERYSDLMRRREQARVSMNLDVDRKGLTLRIDETAYFPRSPTGIRFSHFLIIGPLLGLLLPIGLLFALRQIDPRIRSIVPIEKKLGIPVLGEIPHLLTPNEKRREKIQFISVIFLFVATLIFIFSFGVLYVQEVM